MTIDTDDDQPPELRRRREVMQNVHISTGDVARILGVSQVWVRTLDAELTPTIASNGRRRYRLDVVERYVTERRSKMWTKHNANICDRTRDAMVVVQIDRAVPLKVGAQWRIDERRLSGRVLAVEHYGREVYGHELTRITIDVGGHASSGLFIRNLPVTLQIEVSR
jgi:hypothetical protein